MEVVFLLAAELDLFEAYERHGENLHDKIDAAIEHLRNHPKIGTSFRGKFRRKLVMRSPFSIYYAIEGRSKGIDS